MPWWLLPVVGCVIGVIYAAIRFLEYLSEKEDRENLESGEIPGSFNYKE